MYERQNEERPTIVGRAGLTGSTGDQVDGSSASGIDSGQSSMGQRDGSTGNDGKSPGRDAGGGNGSGRKPYHVLTREDRSKGGTKSATMQGRDEYGQFAGNRRQQQQQAGSPSQQKGPRSS